VVTVGSFPGLLHHLMVIGRHHENWIVRGRKTEFQDLRQYRMARWPNQGMKEKKDNLRFAREELLYLTTVEGKSFPRAQS